MTARGVRLLVCFAMILAALPVMAAAAPGVRVARLSLAQGDVQIDRNSGDGWEQALNNMPVVGGASIFAGDNSKAEIQFEDGSSVRLAGPAQFSLTELSTSANGAPITRVEVDSGIAYVNARIAPPAGFQILTPSGETIAVNQPTHLRLKIGEQVASLSVTEGEVEILKDGGNVTLPAGQTYNYILGQPESAVRSSTVLPHGEDEWNQQRDSYNDQNAPAGAQGLGGDDPNAAGVADLGYYGSYDNVPDCGQCWQPTGVGQDWDPYDYGAWSYYDDWGWTFVSGYPWGWAPFYYGNWNYIGGRGWWWRPGAPHGPHGWHPRPSFAGAPRQGFTAPHPPADTARGTVAVAGSNLHVGPTAQTHETVAANSVAAGRQPSAATSSTVAKPVAASNPTHAGASSAGASNTGASNTGTSKAGAPVISGAKGTYRLSNPTAGGRNGFTAHGGSEASTRGEGYSSAGHGYAPSGSYGGNYGGSSAPHAYASPGSVGHASMPSSSVAHYSGGSSAFHGGGGGGSHGGGGGGGHR